MTSYYSKFSIGNVYYQYGNRNFPAIIVDVKEKTVIYLIYNGDVHYSSDVIFKIRYSKEIYVA